MGSSKLLLGLGLGSMIGGALVYLSNTTKGKEVRRHMCHAMHDLEDNAQSMLSSAKYKAEKMGSNVVNKVNEKANDMKDKMHDGMNKMHDDMNKMHDPMMNK